MVKCVISGEELPKVTVNFVGYECRIENKELCPNYMRNFVNGRNCRLLQNNDRKYAKCCLRSTLEPIKEQYKNKGTVELAALYKALEEKYLDSIDADKRTNLRNQLGAIEEILLERKKGV